MKTLFTFLLCLSVSLAFAQGAMYPSDYPEKALTGMASEPFKKANTILLQTNLSQEAAFLLWGQFLLAQGYTLDNTNKDFYTISTGPKDTSRLNYDYLVNATISPDGTIQVQAKYRVKSSILANSRATNYYNWSFKGPKEAVSQDILALVKAFNHPASYTVR